MSRPRKAPGMPWVVLPNGCWQWTGATKDGHGVTVLHGNEHTAHRFVYIMLRGDVPIRDLVKQTCANPLCVNPDHMTIGAGERPAEPPKVPELTSDQMRLLGPLITVKALELAQMRFAGQIRNLACEARPLADKATVRTAIILYRTMLPDAPLSVQEEAVRVGVDRKEVGRERAKAAA